MCPTTPYFKSEVLKRSYRWVQVYLPLAQRRRRLYNDNRADLIQDTKIKDARKSPSSEMYTLITQLAVYPDQRLMRVHAEEVSKCLWCHCKTQGAFSSCRFYPSFVLCSCLFLLPRFLSFVVFWCHIHSSFSQWVLNMNSNTNTRSISSPVLLAQTHTFKATIQLEQF